MECYEGICIEEFPGVVCIRVRPSLRIPFPRPPLLFCFDSIADFEDFMNTLSYIHTLYELFKEISGKVREKLVEKTMQRS